MTAFGLGQQQYGPPVAPPAPPFVPPVIMGAGQSNCGGRDTDFTGWPAAANPNVRICDATGFYAFGQDLGRGGSQIGTHGIEFTLGNAIAAANVGPFTGPAGGLIYYAKSAFGGTNITDFLGPSGIMFNNIINTASNVIAACRPESGVAFVWQQGENEAQGAPGSDPANYAANLQLLETQMKNKFGPLWRFIFYVVQVNIHCPDIAGTGLAPNTALVQSQEAAFVAANPNFRRLINLDTITPSAGNGLHYSSGQTFGIGTTASQVIIPDWP